MTPLASASATLDGSYAVVLESAGHRLTADEPRERHGTDTGASPYGLLLAALGACTAITLQMYAERKGWQLGRLKVDLQHFKEASGAERIERQLRFSGALSDEQRQRLIEIAEKTPVTKTLRAGVAIATRLA